MIAEEANRLVDRWLRGIEYDIPMFDCHQDGCELRLHSGLVRQSRALKARLIDIKKDAQTEFMRESGAEGVLYLIYRRTASHVEPLYLGIAECVGKSGKLSALFGTAGWVRFADHPKSNGHIGNFNGALAGSSKSYVHWKECLLDPQLGSPPRLRSPVFVQLELWRAASTSIVPALGHTPLTLEEMLRLHLLKVGGFGESLLNRNGNRRRKP